MRKDLYIFDFDETLVSTKGKVFIVNNLTNERKEIKHHDYVHYDLLENESFDVSEFDEVIDPTINEELMKMLRENSHRAVILTARDKSEPVKEYLLNAQSIDVPVNAVGVYKPGKQSNVVNAKRKRIWIQKAIEKGKYTHITFWDDNDLNINEVNKLKDTFPNVVFNNILVKGF